MLHDGSQSLFRCHMDIAVYELTLPLTGAMLAGHTVCFLSLRAFLLMAVYRSGTVSRRPSEHPGRTKTAFEPLATVPSSLLTLTTPESHHPCLGPTLWIDHRRHLLCSLTGPETLCITVCTHSEWLQQAPPW